MAEYATQRRTVDGEGEVNTAIFVLLLIGVPTAIIWLAIMTRLPWPQFVTFHIEYFIYDTIMLKKETP